jgi:transketolase N-terminal domain/subunit
MNDLERRVIDISYQERIGHLSSNLNAVNIIDEIYKEKQDSDIFILSSGHAALAWYTVLEKYKKLDAVELFHKHGVHPHRNVEDEISVSTGSLGMGITVACGYALANPNKNIYCLLSDGECAEGSVWEALRFIKEKNINNLYVYVNVNGMIAYDFIDKDYLTQRLKSFLPEVRIRFTDVPKWPWAEGILTHYYVLKPEDYQKLCETDLEN